MDKENNGRERREETVSETWSTRILGTPEYYPDDFTRRLNEEGLLKCSNPVSNVPVLNICYGYSDSELGSLSWFHDNERRFKETYNLLGPESRASYDRLFASHYPLEPLVDGLPQSVWLECVEPTLSILKTLNTLKRRKSNLSLRKASMMTPDSNSSCKGDFAIAPLLLNPLRNVNNMNLMQAQILAMGGVLGMQIRNLRTHLNEGQLTATTFRSPTQAELQRRRRHRQHRPYNHLGRELRNLREHVDQLLNSVNLAIPLSAPSVC